MTTRMIQIIADKEKYEEIKEMIKENEIIDSWEMPDLSQRRVIFSIILALESSQSFLDSMQAKIDEKIIKKILISSPEAVLPLEEFAHRKKESVPRQELYNQVFNHSTLNLDFVFLIIFSTVVGALGLLQDQVIAIIAAIVIAPILEPNLAIAFAVGIGDMKLMLRAIKINITGILVCLILSCIIGFFWPHEVQTSEFLLRRTNVGYSSIVLAVVAGAAGAISLTSRFLTVLVGVMVAAALLPPLVAAGILLGSGNSYQAIGAALLFIVNILCVNLSANLVFIFKGIHPRKWYQRHEAKEAIFWYLLFWIFSLLAICISFYFHFRFFTSK